MSQTTPLAKVSLYNQLNGSDKVYHLAIVAQTGGYSVEAAWGRRGGTMATGAKTPNGTPVSLAAAQKIFDTIQRQKLSKGYQAGPDQVPAFAGNNATPPSSGLLPQLLNEADEAAFRQLIDEDDYFFQEKKDGVRLMVRRHNGLTDATNRRGLNTALPAEVATELDLINADLVLDGELIGDVFWAFDILASPGNAKLAEHAARERYGVLADLIDELLDRAKGDLRHVKLVTAATTAADKRTMYDRLLADGAEGVVAKMASAAYTPGRPASGGPWLKRKFVATATVRVVRVNAQRSILVEVLADDRKTWTPIGNVAIPVNRDVPEIGALVEVRYLYAYPGGNLIQPFFLGLRPDAIETECTMTQLKYKKA